ncbi:MAG: S26 family signal peptidase [Planctomycetota bacterium]
MSHRAIVVWTRRGLLLAALGALFLSLRRYSIYRIPGPDASMDPLYPGGARVLVEAIEPRDPLERGTDVVYAWEQHGATHARFGRVGGLPGDVVGADAGLLTANGQATQLRGEPMGTVPPGFVLVPNLNPRERTYPDSRTLGFIARARIRFRIRTTIGMPW